MRSLAEAVRVPTGTPLITCVIPTFNRRRLMTRAVASVLAQDFPGTLVHVFDNHSSDDTARWLGRMSALIPNLTATIRPSNIGVYANFNRACDTITTPYFSMLSDDDLLLPGFYHEAVTYLEQHPECGLYCGDTVQISPGGQVRSSSNYLWTVGSLSSSAAHRRIRHCGAPTCTGIVFRREVLDVARLREEAGSPSDVDFILEAARHFGIHVSRRPCAALTMSTATVSSCKPLAWVFPCWEEVMARHCLRSGTARTKDVLFMADRYFADLISILVQDRLNDADRRAAIATLRRYPHWNGLGNLLVRAVAIHGHASPRSPILRGALTVRKLLKLVENPLFLLNFLKLRRIDRAFTRFPVFAW